MKVMILFSTLILHYDGGSWSSEPSGTQQPLMGIWGDDEGNMFAVGENGTILKRIVK